ncbi:MAG: glutaredoxin domain-containing protein [Candidatus Paceibacterota bacterium]|jgi:glutaredoxin
MDKKIIISTALFLLLSAAAIFVLGSEKNPSGDNNGTSVPPAPAGQIVLYYGSTCPHCKDVEAWLKTNNVQAKVSYQEKEVYENKDNSKELIATAKVCGKDENSIGVPFLWTGSDCLVGYDQIIQFFEQKISTSGAQN